jgi:flagellar assembly protein FliH
MPAKSSSEAALMTSSFKATGHAAVRATPAAQVSGSTAWFLDELVLPTAKASVFNAPAAKEVVNPQLLAEERARLIDEGYARGLADGEHKARLAAQATLEQALGVVHEMSSQLSEVVSLAPAVLEENVAALAVIVARQIIGREVGLDKDVVANLVRRALTEFPVDQSVRIRVNPVDLSLLGAGGTSITGKRDVSWLADPRISRGGCLVEGRERIVDGRVDTALERAYRRLAQVDAS